MNEFIRVLPGKLLKADGTQTNILESLDVNVSPMSARNDGYKKPEIAAVQIGENQYALADILDAVAEKMNAGETLDVIYTNTNDTISCNKTMAEIDAAIKSGVNLKMIYKKGSYEYPLKINQIYYDGDEIGGFYPYSGITVSGTNAYVYYILHGPSSITLRTYKFTVTTV